MSGFALQPIVAPVKRENEPRTHAPSAIAARAIRRTAFSVSGPSGVRSEKYRGTATTATRQHASTTPSATLVSGSDPGIEASSDGGDATFETGAFAGLTTADLRRFVMRPQLLTLASKHAGPLGRSWLPV